MESNRNVPALYQGFHSLPEEKKMEHRANVGVLLDALLSNFWVSDKMTDEARAVDKMMWVNALQEYQLDEIERAWTQYTRTGHKAANGRPLKPYPDDIADIAHQNKVAEARKNNPQDTEPNYFERRLPTPEERAARLAQKQAEANEATKGQSIDELVSGFLATRGKLYGKRLSQARSDANE